MGKNLETVTNIVVFILALGFSIWNFYISSYVTAVFMLVITFIIIGYLVKEIREKRNDKDNNY